MVKKLKNKRFCPNLRDKRISSATLDRGRHNVFKSKRISLITIFALLLPSSAGIAGFGSSVAFAATTDLQTFTVNGAAVTDGATVDLEPYTTSVVVVAEAADPTSTVTTVGGTELTTGSNDLVVTVTDTELVAVNYTVILNVLASNDTSASISINGEEVSSGDNFLVDWGTSSVDVVVALTDVNATYFITGDLDLATGDNALTVTVAAADGLTITDYVFNVLVLPNTDTSTNSVTVNRADVADGDTLDLEPLTTDADVQVDTVDTDATVEIIGASDLVAGSNDLLIVITAADGETLREISVTLNVLLNTDVSLSTFNVAGVDVADADYVTVEPLTTEVEVIVEATDPEASFEIIGGTDLVPGENDLQVIVTAADGETVGEYFVVIVVAPNTDTSLESLIVNGEETDDGGVVYLDPFTTEVDVEVTTTDADATFIIDGDIGLSVGENNLVVIVAAADGETTQEYLITLVVALSNDASLSAMTISWMDADGDQSFQAVDGDEIDLPSKTYSVDVLVEPTDPEATFEVSGNTDLLVGENQMVVTVTAPDGEATEDFYVLLRVAVGDVTTASFTVNGTEVADGDVVDVEAGSESVDIAVETTDPEATYEITGGDSLVLGANDLVLTVTSVDETLTVEYHVTLNVLPSADASFSSIEVNGIAWEEGVVLETPAGDLDVVVTTNNEFASVAVEGQTTNVSGLTQLVVTVTAQDGETTESAEITVIAVSDIQVVPNSALGDGQLRVGTWIKVPRAQFGKQYKVTYGWARDFEFIDGATSAKYLLTVDDFGHDLRAVVRLNKAGSPEILLAGSAIEVSAGLITKAPTPSIKGKAAVGNTLTANTKAWIDGAELTYQWYRDGDAVDGATSETFDLTAEDFEASISVGITGTLEAYEPLEKVSVGVAVAAGVLKYSDKPSISGEFVTGGTVTVNAGSWIDGAEVAIVWSRNGEEFASTTADENTYVLTAEDYRTRLSVDILVTAAGYKDATFKMKSRSIKIGTLAEVPAPTVSGDNAVDGVLEVDPGEYPEGTEFKFVWKRDGRVIHGGNDSSYTVTLRDIGTTISVKVIATIPGYKTTRVDSEGVEVTNIQ